MGWYDAFESKVNEMVQQAAYDDGSTNYANRHNLWIEFMGVGTGRAVRFKAFLTDFNDNFESSWNEEEVYGRSDPIVTFQGTKRNLEFAFGVPAASFAEALHNFQQLSLLIALLYPGYDGEGATSISTSPLFKVKFHNWVTNGSGGSLQESGLVAAIKGFSFSPDLEAGAFDDNIVLHPKLFNVTCSMTVLHTSGLGWGPNGEWRGGLFPYGIGFSAQPDGMELPVTSVTQAGDNGATGTEEMQEASVEEVLNGGMSEWGGTGMTPIDAPMSVNALEGMTNSL